MRVLILGGGGFVGSELALQWRDSGCEVVVLDNFSRRGSYGNIERLESCGVAVIHGDIRDQDDLLVPGKVDWIIDAAANPSVLAGIGENQSRPLMMQNLVGTINGLEHAKRNEAGFILLSTSRVYNIPKLATLPVEEQNGKFVPQIPSKLSNCLSENGIREEFDTSAPISLYGASKLSSETIVQEYGEAFGLPTFVDRCGVIAGPGQFGKPDQGIFSFWVNSYLHRRPMKYIGFEGSGFQVRDCLHPADLFTLLEKQMQRTSPFREETLCNVSGGSSSALSLKELSQWCGERWGEHEIVQSSEERPYDLPWVVLDSSKAKRSFDWTPRIAVWETLEQIAVHAEDNPDWLKISGVC